MPLVISDDILRAAKMTEGEARVEFACRLFEAGRLELWPAAELAGLSRLEMEAELKKREIAIYRPTAEELAKELASMEKLGE
jgi:predicted HTH domain antitoxin